jgi:hypothetical protein
MACQRTYLDPHARLSVRYIQPLIATRQRGVTVGEAAMWDGTLVRFRIVARDPATVRVVSEGAGPAHERAISAWLEEGRSQTVP